MSDLRLRERMAFRPIEMPEIHECGPGGEAGAANFMGFKEAIGHGQRCTQTGASQAVDALVTGQSTNIHQTMVALQQADVSFQLMMQVRNKLVTAYEEIQRMQI